MLIFTNRSLKTSAANGTTLTACYPPFSDVLNSVQVTPSASGWTLEAPKKALTDADVVRRVAEVLAGSQPVLLFLHGNDVTPEACFARCQLLEEQHKVAVIGYSWASEGYLPNGTEMPGPREPSQVFENAEDGLAVVNSMDDLKEGWIERRARRYAQTKVNAQHGKDSFARLLRLVAAARLGGLKQKVSFAAHSLGCHLLHYTMGVQDAEASLSAMHNVVLMAGCTGAAKHAAWVGRIHPLLRVYVTYTKADSVLFAASLIDGDTKLGSSPGTDRLQGSKYRYVDFEGAAKMRLGAHRYYIADSGKTLSKPTHLFFSRVFASEPDFVGGADEQKKVYPLGCSDDGLVCLMGNGAVERGRR